MLLYKIQIANLPEESILKRYNNAWMVIMPFRPREESWEIPSFLPADNIPADLSKEG
jgi:hypothetical protein